MTADLRNNITIKGIKVRDKEVLLSSFADDIHIYLDGCQSSFDVSCNKFFIYRC